MADENLDGMKDGEALTLISAQVLSMVSTVMSRMDEEKKRIDAQEQMLAQLLMGYSELTVLVQGMVAKMMADMNEEDSKEFLDTLNNFRMEMVQAVQDAARGEEGNYANFASALSRLGGFRTSEDSGQRSADTGTARPKSP